MEHSKLLKSIIAFFTRAAQKYEKKEEGSETKEKLNI